MDLNLDQFKDQKFYQQAFSEFLATTLWILLSTTEAAGASPWAAGIMYVVIQMAVKSFDSGSVHMFTPYTLYKILCLDHLDPIKGLVWVGLQMLGAYVGGLLSGALELTQVSNSGLADNMSDVALGFRMFFALMFILHVFIFVNCDKAESDIPKSILLVFGFAITFWFMDGMNCNVNFVNQFAYSPFNGNVWTHLVWTLVAVVVTRIKMYLLSSKE